MTDQILGNIQTRSESLGIRNFRTLHDALAYARDESSVWKISFEIQDSSRIRLVKTTEGWTYENIFTGGRYD